MTFDYYKNRETLAAAFNEAADAVRKEKEEKSGKDYRVISEHVKKQLRRAIWEEEDSPEPISRNLVFLFNLYADAFDAKEATRTFDKRLFFYLVCYVMDEITARLELETDRLSADFLFYTLRAMTANRRSSEEYQRGERLRQKIEKEEKEGGTE